MKITVSRDKFSQLFSLVSSVRPARDIKPVLMNVKLIASNNGLAMMGTDSEVAIRGELTDEVLVDRTGEALLPGDLVRKILQESQDKELVIDSQDDETTISCGRAFYKLSTQRADDFPTIESFDESEFYRISGRLLQDMIRRTNFAIDTENARYALGGVLFDFEGESVSAVSTDGKRLAFQLGSTTPTENIGDRAGVFPLNALKLLLAAVGDEESVKITLAENKGIVQIGSKTIHTQLVDGKFPRWKTIIPEKVKKEQVDLVASAFSGAVRQAGLVSSDQEPAVELRFSSGKLEISAQTAEVGFSRTEMPITYDGAAINIRFDPKFFIDGLKVLGDRTVTLYFLPDKPMLLETQDQFSYVIMPLA